MSGFGWPMPKSPLVIASEAKQSNTTRNPELDCFVALQAPRNDEGRRYETALPLRSGVTLSASRWLAMARAMKRAVIGVPS
jgi:hypothetical protein